METVSWVEVSLGDETNTSVFKLFIEDEDIFEIGLQIVNEFLIRDLVCVEAFGVIYAITIFLSFFWPGY